MFVGGYKTLAVPASDVFIRDDSGHKLSALFPRFQHDPGFYAVLHKVFIADNSIQAKAYRQRFCGDPMFGADLLNMFINAPLIHKPLLVTLYRQFSFGWSFVQELPVLWEICCQKNDADPDNDQKRTTLFKHVFQQLFLPFPDMDPRVLSLPPNDFNVYASGFCDTLQNPTAKKDAVIFTGSLYVQHFPSEFQPFFNVYIEPFCTTDDIRCALMNRFLAQSTTLKSIQFLFEGLDPDSPAIYDTLKPLFFEKAVACYLDQSHLATQDFSYDNIVGKYEDWVPLTAKVHFLMCSVHIDRVRFWMKSAFGSNMNDRERKDYCGYAVDFFEKAMVCFDRGNNVQPHSCPADLYLTMISYSVALKQTERVNGLYNQYRRAFPSEASSDCSQDYAIEKAVVDFYLARPDGFDTACTHYHDVMSRQVRISDPQLFLMMMDYAVKQNRLDVISEVLTDLRHYFEWITQNPQVRSRLSSVDLDHCEPVFTALFACLDPNNAASKPLIKQLAFCLDTIENCYQELNLSFFACTQFYMALTVFNETFRKDPQDSSPQPGVESNSSSWRFCHIT